MNVITNTTKDIDNDDLKEEMQACLHSVRSEYCAWVYDNAAQIAIKLRETQRFREGMDFLINLQKLWQEYDKPFVFDMELGHALRHNQNFQGAIEAYHRAITKSPRHAWGILCLARCYFLTGKHLEAQQTIANEVFSGDLSPNLFGELKLLEIDIAIAGARWDCLVDHYRLLADRVADLPQYVLLSMLNKLYLVSKRNTAFSCLITFSFYALENSILFRVARVFHDINDPLLAISTLLRINQMSKLQQHQWNLLIVCVLESADFTRGAVWHEAKLIIDQEYAQRQNKNGFWQYWTDYWCQPMKLGIRNGKNIGVELPETLKKFNTAFWASRRERCALIGHSEIPKHIVIFSRKVNVASRHTSRELKEQLHTVGNDYSAQHFDLTEAGKYIASIVSNRIKRAWRLSRNHQDQVSLFTLCYLVEHGGYVISDAYWESIRAFVKSAQEVQHLLLVKGELGVNTGLIAAKPGHPLLAAILESIVQSLLNRSRLPALYVTGSVCWAKILLQYSEEMAKRGNVPEFTMRGRIGC